MPRTASAAAASPASGRASRCTRHRCRTATRGKSTAGSRRPPPCPPTAARGGVGKRPQRHATSQAASDRPLWGRRSRRLAIDQAVSPGVAPPGPLCRPRALDTSAGTTRIAGPRAMELLSPTLLRTTASLALLPRMVLPAFSVKPLRPCLSVAEALIPALSSWLPVAPEVLACAQPDAWLEMPPRAEEAWPLPGTPSVRRRRRCPCEVCTRISPRSGPDPAPSLDDGDMSEGVSTPLSAVRIIYARVTTE